MSKTFNILFILQWCNKPVSQAVGVAAMNRHPRDLPTEIMAIGWPTLRQSPWILSAIVSLSNFLSYIYDQSVMLLHTPFWPPKMASKWAFKAEKHINGFYTAKNTFWWLDFLGHDLRKN